MIILLAGVSTVFGLCYLHSRKREKLSLVTRQDLSNDNEIRVCGCSIVHNYDKDNIYMCGSIVHNYD